jgi:hypothetical protein
MRRIALAALLGLALAIASVAPAFAGNGGAGAGKTEGNIPVWCSLDGGTSKADLNGNLVVPDGSSGKVTLWLFSSTDGTSWVSTGHSKSLDLVQGQTIYPFLFGGNLDATMDYKISGDGAWSRVINGDECGFRVPEAPATPLLLLGAFPAGALIALKATGVRLPMPHLHRIV